MTAARGNFRRIQLVERHLGGLLDVVPPETVFRKPTVSGHKAHVRRHQEHWQRNDVEEGGNSGESLHGWRGSGTTGIVRPARSWVNRKRPVW